MVGSTATVVTMASAWACRYYGPAAVRPTGDHIRSANMMAKYVMLGLRDVVTIKVHPLVFLQPLYRCGARENRTGLHDG